MTCWESGLPAASSNTFPIVFINRDCDRERRRCIERELAAAGMSATRIPAVEGLAVPPVLSRYFLLNGELGSKLSPGEVGCYASHLLAAKFILAQGLPFSLVVEDDAILPASLRADLRDILSRAPDGWDIIQLSGDPRHGFLRVCRLNDGRHIVRHSRIPANTVGYLISAAGARKLLSQGIRRWPIDTDLRQPWVFDLDVFGVVPRMIAHNGRLPSALLEYGERSRLRRGIHRPTLQYPLGSPFHTLQSARFNIRCLGIAWWSRCLLANAWRRVRRGMPAHINPIGAGQLAAVRMPRLFRAQR